MDRTTSSGGQRGTSGSSSSQGNNRGNQGSQGNNRGNQGSQGNDRGNQGSGQRDRDAEARERAAQAEREREARERAAQAERDREARERAAQAERDREARDRAAQAERDREARERAAQAERDRQARDRAAQAERDREARERAAQAERDREARERAAEAAKERAEKERAEKERAEKERADRDREDDERAAQDDDDDAPSRPPAGWKDLEIGRVTASGPGCPAGSWKGLVDESGESFQFDFTKLTAQVTPSRAESVAQCRLTITVPSQSSGMSYRVAHFSYTGYTYLEKGVNAEFSAEYAFAGNRVQKVITELKGPMDDEYTVDDKANGEILWSPCSTSNTLTVDVTVRLTNGKPAVDGLFEVADTVGLQFESRACK